MSNDEPDDLPSAVTRLLRNVDGVHTVYATRAPIPTIVTAVVELVKNEPVGVHLVTVTENDDTVTVAACIGVTGDEPAAAVSRRACDAISDMFVRQGDQRELSISVSIGRVG
jgi:hypothetical protein